MISTIYIHSSQEPTFSMRYSLYRSNSCICSYVIYFNWIIIIIHFKTGIAVALFASELASSAFHRLVTVLV